MRNFWFRLVMLTGLVLPLAGCGYHVAGKGTNLPTTVHTIAIPVFTNQTHTYRIETILTNAVVREFNSRTNFRIVADSRGADAILRGYVLTAQTTPVTYDSTNGRASTALVTVTMNVNLYDRDGKVLYRNNNYLFREEYQISREISSFFDEESPALDRLSRDFARSLVSNVLEAY